MTSPYKSRLNTTTSPSSWYVLNTRTGQTIRSGMTAREARNLVAKLETPKPLNLAELPCCCPLCSGILPTSEKAIEYCRRIHDFGAYYQGELVGFYFTYLLAENAINDYVYALRARQQAAA